MEIKKMREVYKTNDRESGSARVYGRIKAGARFVAALLSVFIFASTHPDTARASQRQIFVKGEASALSMPTWVAKELGLYNKYGLNVELIAMSGGALGIRALLGGSIQVATNSPMAPINAISSGGDLVFVGGVLNKSLYKIVARKNLQKPADLVGKRIGVTGLGGANEFAVLLALREWKIPASSVQIITTGAAANRIASVLSGSTDATILPYDHVTIAEDRGLNSVADLADIVPEFPDKMIIVNRSFLNNERDYLKRFLQAISESIFILKNGIEKERIIARYSKQLRADRQQAEEIYKTYHKIFSYPPRVGQKGMREVVEFMQREKGKKADINISRIIDESLIDELQKEGFFQKLEARL
jgi:NitT/TauT family transport system substrate-binding protein